MIALHKHWHSIWLALANNDISQYNIIKGMPEREFYDLFELHEERLERLKQQANGSRR